MAVGPAAPEAEAARAGLAPAGEEGQALGSRASGQARPVFSNRAALFRTLITGVLLEVYTIDSYFCAHATLEVLPVPQSLISDTLIALALVT